MDSGRARPRESLRKADRLASRREFVRVYESGRKFFGKFVVIFAAPALAEHSRIGITVTRKAGNAVVRNRAKRWVREIYRRNRAATGVDQVALDFVVNVRNNIVDAQFEEVEADVLRTLRKAARPAPAAS